MTLSVLSQLRREILLAADPSYAEFSRVITPTGYPIRGVRIPIVRKIAARLIRQGVEEIPLGPASSHEEILIAAILLARSKLPFNQFFPKIDPYLMMVDNWASCDLFCSELKRVKSERSLFWESIIPLLHDRREFYVRFAEVILLNYYVSQEYISNVLKLLASVRHSGRYAQMGAAWGISVCYISFPEETGQLLCSQSLPVQLRTMAIRKIRESNRVLPAQKERVCAIQREMKNSAGKDSRRQEKKEADGIFSGLF